MKFSNKLETKASRQTIWKIWTDVDNWAIWDTELKESKLETEFKLGAKGSLIPKKGLKAAFEITELKDGESYAFTTKLPLAELKVRRFFSEKTDKTEFVHEVSFAGFLGGLWGIILGGTFKAVLPKVMENLKNSAEQKSKYNS
jgi:hypothetical protein